MTAATGDGGTGAGLRLSARLPQRGLEVDLAAAGGQTLAILGPNGAGKSTVLALAAGLLRPETGRVALDGRVLTAVVRGRTLTWVPPHRRQITLLAQDPLLFPHLDVLDNVAFGARARGLRTGQARRVAAGWLDAAGVADLAGRRPSRLSGGQAQRVALARALAAEPGLLLLDEPMASLDVDVVPALRQTLRRVLAGRTAVLVTHDALDALLLADRVAVLQQGRVVESGPPAEVLGRPRSAFAARMSGLNMVRGQWRSGAVRSPAGRRVEGLVTGPDPAPGEEAVAVFRPNAVAVYPGAPGGSPRNSFEVIVTAVEPHGDYVRVRADELAADITPRAAAELALGPGARVVFSVKATEVAVYPT